MVRAIFTEFLTPRLICELNSLLDDWLEWLIVDINQSSSRFSNLQVNPKVPKMVNKGLSIFLELEESEMFFDHFVGSSTTNFFML